MTYDITAFGAVGDGTALCTAAIQAAIDACHAQGGGRVTVPAGCFKTGTLYLKSHVELHLSHAATLLASENLDDYNEEDAYVQNYHSDAEEWNGKHLLIALDAEDVALTGSGCIDGNGHLFYDAPVKKWSFLWVDGLALSRDKVNLRPGQLLCFIQCRHVRVEGIRIRNNTCWCCFLHGCEYVDVHGITIQNPSTFANTDGVDIDTCRYVTVSDCIIDTADDAIAIRGCSHRLTNGMRACEHITVSNCVLGSSSGAFRLGVGDSPIRHVRVSNISVSRCATGFILCSDYSKKQGRYTPICDVAFHNVSVIGAQRAMKFSAAKAGVIENVSFENIYCEVRGGSYLKSPEGKHIRDLRVRDLHMHVMDKGELSEAELAERRDVAIRMENVVGSRLERFRITGLEATTHPWRAAMLTEHCELATKDCNFEIITEDEQ